MNDLPTVDELDHLYASLAPDERDELLVAAAHGGEAMAAVMDVWLLDCDCAGRELLSDIGQQE